MSLIPAHKKAPAKGPGQRLNNKGYNNMSNNNEECRNTQAEIEREGHAGQHDADGAPYHNTQAEMVRERVEELMDADSTDEDSMVVLMESEYFRHALRRIMHQPHHKKSFSKTAALRLANLSNNLIAVAESVLTQYVENKP
jgi:hypothetical protein